MTEYMNVFSDEDNRVPVSEAHDEIQTSTNVINSIKQLVESREREAFEAAFTVGDFFAIAGRNIRLESLIESLRLTAFNAGFAAATTEFTNVENAGSPPCQNADRCPVLKRAWARFKDG